MTQRSQNCISRLSWTRPFLYITCHLADAFIQSDFQLIRLSRRQSSLEQCGVKGLSQGPNSCADLIMATPGIEPSTLRVQVKHLNHDATGCPFSFRIISFFVLFTTPTFSLGAVLRYSFQMQTSLFQESTCRKLTSSADFFFYTLLQIAKWSSIHNHIMWRTGLSAQQYSPFPTTKVDLLFNLPGSSIISHRFKPGLGGGKTLSFCLHYLTWKAIPHTDRSVKKEKRNLLMSAKFILCQFPVMPPFYANRWWTESKSSETAHTKAVVLIASKSSKIIWKIFHWLKIPVLKISLLSPTPKKTFHSRWEFLNLRNWPVRWCLCSGALICHCSDVLYKPPGWLLCC